MKADKGSRRGSKEFNQDLLADSANLVRGSLADFNVNDDDEAGADKRSVVKGLAQAFKKSGDKSQPLGFNEALGVSNLGVSALQRKEDPDSNVKGVGSDRTGIASETLAGSKGRSGRRKSSLESAPKISKMKKSLVHEAMKDFVAVTNDDERTAKNQRREGDRCIITVAGEDRDTGVQGLEVSGREREAESPRACTRFSLRSRPSSSLPRTPTAPLACKF